MAASLLAVSSLLPSQSIFNEIQSIHETGFFHEMQSIGEVDPVPPGKVKIAVFNTIDQQIYWSCINFTLHAQSSGAEIEVIYFSKLVDFFLRSKLKAKTM